MPIQLEIKSPARSLNKAYLKETAGRSSIEKCKQQLLHLLEKADPASSEDTLKDYITDFLKNTWYSPEHAITINKEKKDFSIHTGKSAKDSVAVIAEVKKLGSAEMITAEKPNVKALHELVLYYLQERITGGNNQVKYLLATDVHQWYLIDANEFDKKIYSNTRIKRLYETYVNDKKDNPFFYDELKRILGESDIILTATLVQLDQYRRAAANTDTDDDKKLVPLYKILSPVHLLKLPFANDSNSLDKNFYDELLHIIGLEEIKEGSKKLILRKKQSSEASLIENAIIKIRDKDCLRDLPDATKYGLTGSEQEYNIALELCITWINRILFLKLLEAQLVSYHQQDRSYQFLNEALLPDYDELNNLFFQVLAEVPDKRRDHLQTKFSKVPYLNSSLFERTEIERRTIDISALDNALQLPLHIATVLKDEKGKRMQGAQTTLSYLFTFLDRYNFTSEGKADIQEENKTLINASVLGLIFEKINGYKDGSFFTPGFITMYMCRETLRRAVTQKFNEHYNWTFENFEALQERIDFQDKEKRQEANTLINSLTICDPAVGSGHFLVSALNELISIKHDLKVLQYRNNGQRIREYSLEIVNDELIIQDVETEELFEYTLNQKGNSKTELQALQETLFHEKETLIENCLFGVDINENSVKICRLRLWIELLKNAYYTPDSQYTQLETLPNIDINIKKGNSLISRFALDADLAPALQKSKFSIESYKAAVHTYRNAESKEEKREMETLIETIKNDFQKDLSPNDPINKKLSKLRGEMESFRQTDLFSADSKKKTKANKELEKLSAAIDKLEKEKTDIKNNAIYKDAFEWRFMFP
ncbi:MAG: class I SAM-dependent DNA methyltransferase, partial [Chitinophagales bacterium]|nr:class I SAM-dependent DNA methyltransferase [Chitinophagales bacterium]